MSLNPSMEDAVCPVVMNVQTLSGNAKDKNGMESSEMNEIDEKWEQFCELPCINSWLDCARFDDRFTETEQYACDVVLNAVARLQKEYEDKILKEGKE